MGHPDLAADRRECCASIGLALIAFGAATGRGAALAAATGPVVGEAGGDQPAFPLAVRPGRRYLEDAAGRPFLLHGDAGWSLIAQLRREDAEGYLEDRRRRGFNAVTVNLLEHKFASNAPANAYGRQPFGVPGDFSTPDEDYFAHADWVLRRAADKGILVLLAPAWLGYRGGGDGWYREMVASGPQVLRDYGRWLGRRYGGFTNILWMHAGDYDPPRKDLVRAVAEGIREFDRHALHTAHCAPETAALEFWAGEPWLGLDNVYTYEPVWRAALKQYARPERLPFILIESAYENEHGAEELRVRAQAYQALLCGAAGQVFGNNPVWHFDGPGLHPAPLAWQEALGSAGTVSMTHLRRLFAGIPWWTLEPDATGHLTGAASRGAQPSAAAVSADRSLAVVYLPTSREVRLDLARLAGPRIAARWFDPAAGRFHPVSGSPLVAMGPSTIAPPEAGRRSGQDWVLVLERSFAS